MRQADRARPRGTTLGAHCVIRAKRCGLAIMAMVGQGPQQPGQARDVTDHNGRGAAVVSAMIRSTCRL
jgi:hypothetical protein